MADNISSMIANINFKTRNDGLIEGRLSISGKRKSFYAPTKAEIKRKARDYLQKVEVGYKEPAKITLNEYAEYWLRTYKMGKIEPSSYTRLYRVWENQIKDGIGLKKIGTITTKDIQELIDKHANPPVGSDVKALALSGLKRIKQMLNPCYEMAVKEGIVSKNPCEDVVLPTESNIEVQTKVQYSLTDTEIEKLRDAALSRYNTTKEYRSRDAFIILLILNLGLRASEALALEWKDINFSENLIYINKTIQSNIQNFDSSGKKTNISSRLKPSTKTNAGVRVLKLNEMCVFYLNELIEYDRRRCIESKYVACTGNGTRNNARNLQRSLDRIVKRAGIIRGENISLHTLRHTFGSTLLRRGVQIEVVSKLMGHANITITYNKYIHVIKEQEAKAMTMVVIC